MKDTAGNEIKEITPNCDCGLTVGCEECNPELREGLENSKEIEIAQTLWLFLCERKRCIWCKTEFREGIVRKHPKETRFLVSSYFWFSPSFLVHSQTTHGFHPGIMTWFLEEFLKD